MAILLSLSFYVNNHGSFCGVFIAIGSFEYIKNGSRYSSAKKRN